jgi:hypothetical protein
LQITIPVSFFSWLKLAAAKATNAAAKTQTLFKIVLFMLVPSAGTLLENIGFSSSEGKALAASGFHETSPQKNGEEQRRVSGPLAPLRLHRSSPWPGQLFG